MFILSVKTDIITCGGNNMKLLIVNAGSSSLKYQVFEMPEEKVLISGTFERIGLDESFYTVKYEGNKDKYEVALPNHDEAIKYLTSDLVKYGVVKSLDEIEGVGHRVVQGGKTCDKSMIIDDEVESLIERFSPIAPLHNPANLIGIRAVKKAMPNAVNVATFDTAFHQTMEEDKYLYAIPYMYAQKYDVRKYGYHGTSHKYLMEYMNKELGKDSVNLITCHIGNGASIAAIRDNKVVDTSMGFTPNAGLIMGTRCGDIDYSIIPYILKETGMTLDEFDKMANKESGLLGLSGISSDSRDVENAMAEGNERAILTQKMYTDRIVDYIAKYYLELDGKVDAIIFTAGVGENSSLLRKTVVDKLAPLGITLDEEANNTRGKYQVISTKESKTMVCVLPTDEEVMIARDTLALIK